MDWRTVAAIGVGVAVVIAGAWYVIQWEPAAPAPAGDQQSAANQAASTLSIIGAVNPYGALLPQAFPRLTPGHVPQLMIATGSTTVLQS